MNSSNPHFDITIIRPTKPTHGNLLYNLRPLLLQTTAVWRQLLLLHDHATFHAAASRPPTVLNWVRRGDYSITNTHFATTHTRVSHHGANTQQRWRWQLRCRRATFLAEIHNVHVAEGDQFDSWAWLCLLVQMLWKVD